MLIPLREESSVSVGNTRRATICRAETKAPELSHVMDNPSIGPSRAKDIGWLHNLLKGTMLPPPVLANKGCPPEAEIERSCALLADLRWTSLLEFAHDRVEPMLTAFDMLLRSGTYTAQLFAVRATILRWVEALLADLKLVRDRLLAHDLAKWYQTLLTQYVQHDSTMQECSSCCAELAETKKQLEELKRKIPQLESWKLELERKMEVTYAPVERSVLKDRSWVDWCDSALERN